MWVGYLVCFVLKWISPRKTEYFIENYNFFTFNICTLFSETKTLLGINILKPIPSMFDIL